MSRVVQAALVVAVVGLGHAPRAAAEPYRWPVQPGPPVTAYYDHGGLKDWRCQGNTYSGHRGTDIGCARNTQIYAGAAGWVKDRADGYGDGYLGSTDGGGFGNHVAIFHGAGDETIYGHMTAGTGLPALGTNLGCAAPIGRSGASGNVTGPHVHFETRINVIEGGSYYSGSADDPFAGPCGGPLSYWTNQNGGNPTPDCPAPPIVDGATLVRDVSVPDGTAMLVGAHFDKTWRLRNTGSSTWGGGYRLVHVGGPDFGSGEIPVSAGPGAEIEVTAHMTATGAGTQRSSWQLAHDGNRFGPVIWVEIRVTLPDLDGDGADSASDCNDADAAIHPGAAERCNRVDDDCDGTVDGSLTRVCCDTGVAVCGETGWSACSVPCDEGGDAPPTEMVTGGCQGAPGGGVAAVALGLVCAAPLARRRRR